MNCVLKRIAFLGLFLFANMLHAEPFYVTYLWHMHQPIYYPYETINDTDSNGYFNFSVGGVHNDRQPNYTSWPKDAVQQGEDRNMAHAGAQCSFSGSLIENLNNLWGTSTANGWDDSYDWARNGLRTDRNNPRLDLVAFPYHHSLMPLTCHESRRKQLQLHRAIYEETWDTGGSYSKGIFPAETAFAEWIIPSLLEEGIEWSLYDNIHLDRACENYPWNNGGSVVEPNLADVQNSYTGGWYQLNNVWAPTRVSAPFGYQPHYAQYVDPESGQVHKIIAVPAARYEGNENARGGYGAFKPENVWTDTSMNNDPSHPMLMVCHSDGDNFGMKNSDAWNGQHGNFLNMCQSNPNFDNSTVQDYLDLYPPDINDIVHIESGSWAGADAGDPEFKKWLSDEYRDGKNPDRYSWSVLIAAQNYVLHADAVDSNYSINDIRWNIGNATAKAWHYYLNAEASDYWYWDFDDQNPWDGNVTRGANLAIQEAQNIANSGNDSIGPSIFPLQREPYNPGGNEWGIIQSNDFEVFTYVYDVSGLQSVTLYWRTDKDGYNPINNYDNELYAGGAGVNAWNTTAMSGTWDPPNKVNMAPDPLARAQTYKANITGQNNVLIDYYVEAVDTQGHIRKSDIFHVFVGTDREAQRVTYTPATPEDCDDITITYDANGGPLTSANPVKIWIQWNHSSTPVSPDMTLNSGVWTYTTAVPDASTALNFYFLDGLGATEGLDSPWEVSISACSLPSTATYSPSAPTACEDVTITYDPGTGPLAGTSPVYIHIGRNNWQDVLDSPRPSMTDNGDGTWSYTYASDPGTYEINFVFTDNAGNWDNNENNNWSASMSACAVVNTQEVCVVQASPVIAADHPTQQNNDNESFDFSALGGYISTSIQGGFGDFGKIYFNYDAGNLYIGGTDMNPGGSNNAVIILLGLNTLSDDATTLWNMNGNPPGLDTLHNFQLSQAMDIAILLGDEWGDGNYASFALESGSDFGQGIFYLSSNSFPMVSSVLLSQYDGAAADTISDDTDGNRQTDRWEARIPWVSLAANGIEDITELRIAGLLVNDTVDGNDRYISGNYIGASASSSDPLDNGNFGLGFVTLAPLDLCLPNNDDSDNDGMPNDWETANGLDPNDSTDATIDSDGDGMQNYQEYTAGTDPWDPESSLLITKLEWLDGVGSKLYWKSSSVGTYSIWSATNLMQSFNLIANGLSAAPPTNSFIDLSNSGNTRRYYKVGVER